MYFFADHEENELNAEMVAGLFGLDGLSWTPLKNGIAALLRLSMTNSLSRSKSEGP
jgi:hypothetical protein